MSPKVIKFLPGYSFKGGERKCRLKQIILFHYERHNEKGYPFGLRRGEIPIEARFFAGRDAFLSLPVSKFKEERNRIEINLQAR